MTIKITVLEQVIITDASNPPRKVEFALPPGEYEMEQIPNPLGHNPPWLALKGTKVGATRVWWKAMEKEGSFTIADRGE